MHCPMSLSNWVSGIKLWAFVLVVVLFTLGCSSGPDDSQAESEILPLPTNTPDTIEVLTATTAVSPTPTHIPVTAAPTLGTTPIAQPTATLAPTRTPTPATPTPQPTVMPAPTQTPTPTLAPTPTPQPTATPTPTQTPEPTPTAMPTGVKDNTANRCKELLAREFNLDEVIANEEVMACWRQLFSPQPTDTPTQPPPPQANSSTGSGNEVNDCKELLGRGFDFDEVVANEEVMACLRQLLGL